MIKNMKKWVKIRNFMFKTRKVRVKIREKYGKIIYEI